MQKSRCLAGTLMGPFRMEEGGMLRFWGGQRAGWALTGQGDLSWLLCWRCDKKSRSSAKVLTCRSLEPLCEAQRV